ncbi:MAG: MoxR family ATPase [Deltaproteobacteria bacterium]|nr:MoxR family ATPase [Deltaproteobacteria bacterium]
MDEVRSRLADQRYICDNNIATVVYLATRLGKPLLVEGPAGVGKTELAKVIAGSLGAELIRMQCYEGIDEAKALYEWEYAKQLLYTQILKEKISEVTAGAATLADAVDRITSQDDVFFSKRFILPRPLLQAIQSEQRSVLLIDEIDKADAEFEAFLLEILSDFQVTVPEIGTIEARHIPIVVLTSNNAREMSDALKRRCLHLYIDFPSPELELEIIRLKVPEAEASLAADITALLAALRKLDLKKQPSISETLDWAKALVIMNARSIGDAIVKDTLSTIAKYEGDLRKAEKELAGFIDKKKSAEKAKEAAAAAATPVETKDLLH